MSIELTPRAAEIVRYARGLLAAGGYNSFSYADISAAVGISKASIHHHFPNKADLVETVLLQYREEARAGLASLAQHVPGPLAQLEAYTGYWAQCIRDGSSPFCICAMLAAELPTIPDPVAVQVRGHFVDLAAWLSGVLGRGASQGVFHLEASPEAEAMAFMAAVHGAMLSARAYGDPEAFVMTVQPLLNRLRSARG